MSSAAAKQKTYRQRQRAGTIIMPVLVNEVALSAALVEARLLQPGLVDDRQALAEGLQQLVHIFCEDRE